MLFNSYAFIFGYLPITLVGHWILSRRWPQACVVWLSAASLAFYAGWNPRYLPLLLASIVANYAFSRVIFRFRKSGRSTYAILAVAVAANLALLGYFKYANFFVEVVQETTGLAFAIDRIILPLGISFFTFTQIAFLVDLSRGDATDLSFSKYLLFVTFFPHLIAGPILHHASIVPQFSWKEDTRREDFEVGAAIFILGLFKKVVIADNLAIFVSPVFDAAAQGHAVGFIEGWLGAITYALQLYFDFSGYSDMAIGLARMCGVRFPLNFASPYKAVNIIEFWRRWHMTLSQLLRDYLYIPLGGNRRGAVRRYANLMITMVLGGLWHGASWTFVIWGALHGLYLVVNHGWQVVRRKLGWSRSFGLAGQVFGVLTTFFAVCVAWVFFRATSLGAASSMLGGMFGVNGVRLPSHWESKLAHLGILPSTWLIFADMGTTFAGTRQLMIVCVCLAVVWLMPNTQQIMMQYKPALEVNAPAKMTWWQWRPSPTWALILSLLSAWPLLWLNQVSEFLYYQF